MGELKLKYENLLAALEGFERSIVHFENTKKEGQATLPSMEHEEVIESLRDSMIKRFEFTIELFWKYIKKYLEEVIDGAPDVNAPKPVIRAACKANLIEVLDAESAIEMIKSRNLTSHIYREEIADQLSKQMPNYYKIMKKYASKLVPVS